MIDEAELTWFLTEGVSVFERSTIGAILDKLEMDAYVSAICPVCKDGIIVEATKKWHSHRLPWVRTAKIGDWCERCNGVGTIPQRLRPEEQKMVDNGDWATSSDHEGQRSAVPDAVLVRYAYVSRSLSRMPIRLRDAITSAYGDEGAELAGTVHGRSWACSPLTTSGMVLLAKERARPVAINGIEPERPIQCMVALATTSMGKGKSQTERIKLLAEAARDAEKLLKEAEVLWDQVLTLEPKKRSS